MRTLKFIVNEQFIAKDPSCDFEGLVPGSDGYVQAVFTLSSEWKGAVIVASFWSVLGVEYPPQKLNQGNICVIPAEALEKRTFYVQLIGVTRNGVKIKTNKIAVQQTGGM